MKRIIWLVLGFALLALLAYAFVPKPVEVELGTVTRGPMQVAVTQEGKTRVCERYVISAPLAGQLQRITRKAGDPVEANKTILAAIEPAAPSLLDLRTREEAKARVRAAESALQRTSPDIARLEFELAQARVQLERTQRLAALQAMSQQELEDKTLAVQVKDAELRMARSAREIAGFELDQARAVLLHFSDPPATQPALFELRAPISGQVLRVIQESSTPVTAGMLLVEVGDIRHLEAVIDVLSRDAVQIRPGAKVFFERWGGDRPLPGTVRRVEPSGFTKISALGVEEQRVNVIADFALPAGQPSLGDSFRFDARIVIWEKPDVVQAPSGALFRQGEQWAAYLMQGGRASLRPLKIGQISGLTAEVLEGLQAGDQVIVHPSDKIRDTVAITPH